MSTWSMPQREEPKSMKEKELTPRKYAQGANSLVPKRGSVAKDNSWCGGVGRITCNMNDESEPQDLGTVGSKIAVRLCGSSIPRNKLVIYFQQKKNGGGEIKSLVYPYHEHGEIIAIIDFEDSKCAQNFIGMETIKISRRDVSVKIQSWNELFGHVVVNMDAKVISNIMDRCPIDLTTICEDAGVHISNEKDDIQTLTGEWYQIAHVKEQILKATSPATDKSEENSSDDTSHSIKKHAVEEASSQCQHSTSTTDAESQSPSQEFESNDQPLLNDTGDVHTDETGGNDSVERGSSQSENDIDRQDLLHKEVKADESEPVLASSSDSVVEAGGDESVDSSSSESVNDGEGHGPLRKGFEDNKSGPVTANLNDCVTEADKEQGKTVSFDFDLVEYMKLTRKEKYDELKDKYEINFQRCKEAVTITFGQKGSDEGADMFCALYDETVKRCIQDIYEMENYESENQVNEGVEAVRQMYEKVHVRQMMEDDAHRVIFIGDEEEIVRHAIRIFQRSLDCTTNNCENKNHPSTSKVAFATGIPWESMDVDSYVEEADELYKLQFPDSKLVIKVHKGDIASQEVDAIVNAANDELRDGGGVTGAIYSAGGETFRKRCRKVMKERNWVKLESWEVERTEACGALKCNIVLHAAAPMWSRLPVYQRYENCCNTMNFMCRQIIDAANNCGARSVSIPAIGTGIYGIPLEIFCGAIVESIVKFNEEIVQTGGKTLSEIRLVNYDDTEAEAIVQYLKNVPHETRL